jgi:DNA-binding MarR family transcriptional regulator
MTETRVEPAAGSAVARRLEHVTAVADLAGLETWRTLLQAHATVVRRLEADLQADGQLSLADLDVLLQLISAPDHHLRMSELADTVLLSRSGMTRRIDRLEAAGLVERHECAADRRGAYAGITDAGAQRLREARPTHLRGIQEHFVSRLSPEELRSVRQALSRLIPADDRSAEQSC